MIGYVTLGTNNFDKAAAFYDELCAVLGGARMMEDEGFIAWTNGEGKAALSIIHPNNGEAATVGNGVMVALHAGSRELVDAVYNKAISLDAPCEGPSGPRGDSGFYAGYFRDVDGNKICVFTM